MLYIYYQNGNSVCCFESLSLHTATACELLDTCRVGNRKSGPAIIDEIFFAQVLRNECDAGAVDTEGAGNMFMCDPESVSAALALKC